MLELDPMNELEFFRITNSIFFAKGSTVFLFDMSSNNSSTLLSCSISCSSPASLRNRRRGIDAEIRRRVTEFLSISLSVNKDGGDEFARDPNQLVEGNGASKGSDESVVVFGEFLGKTEKPAEEKKVRGSRALNTTKHLWVGAVAAMVSRTFIAPLERMKLEYIFRGEQKHLSELIKTIAAREGMKGFWKGNFINILRTAPFKAINFYAYDTYRSQLLKLSGNEETTNFERFVAGAAAGITATLICLQMDTIRTTMVAPGGEARAV